MVPIGLALIILELVSLMTLKAYEIVPLIPIDSFTSCTWADMILIAVLRVWHFPDFFLFQL